MSGRKMSFVSRYKRRFSRLIAGLQVSPLAHEVRRKGLTYLSNRKLLNLEKCLTQLNSEGIHGDVLEFGVALGGSGILLAKQLGPGRRYFGFDVFGMIPPPNPKVDGQDSISRYGEIASGNSKGIAGKSYYGYEKNLLDKVKKEFEAFGLIDPQHFFFVKGLFESAWPKIAPEIEAVALIHIDCDWHDAVAYCLENASGKVSIGGVLVVDDYNDYAGAKKAVDEFLKTSNNFRIHKKSENLILKKIA
jgi:O-methyltransferase